MKDIKDYITTIPDFPIKGIMFRDVTSLLSNSEGFNLALSKLIEIVKKINPDVICGIESRGFIFGSPIAYALNKKFVAIRKKGKLPRKTISESYDLEYGSASLEICVDDIKENEKVVIIDDLIATGGTFRASINLVERLKGKVEGLLCVIELEDFDTKGLKDKYNVYSLVKYGGK